MGQMNFSVCVQSFHWEGVQFSYQNPKAVFDRVRFFFSFFFSMVTVIDMNKVMKFLQLGEYYI